MSVDSTLGTTNIKWAGNYASGLYNSCYRDVIGLGYTTNFSGCKFMRRSVQPKVFSTSTGTTNYSIGDLVRSKAVKFYFNITLGTKFASSGVRYDFPFLTSYATSQSALNAANLSADATYQSCTASGPNYGYSFSNWRRNTTNGTIVSYSANFLFFFNNSNQSGATNLLAMYTTIS
tara:strand:- start:2203 stop:2730 length:528 start_codon:yes stop_codon:yes gene_type:complete